MTYMMFLYLFAVMLMMFKFHHLSIEFLRTLFQRQSFKKFRFNLTSHIFVKAPFIVVSSFEKLFLSQARN